MARLTPSQSLRNIASRKFVRLQQSHPIPMLPVSSLWVVSPLCRLSLKMLFVMFGMAHSASCLRRALGLGGEREMEKERERERERERELSIRGL